MFLGRYAQCCYEVYYLRLLIYYLFVCVYVAPRVHLTKHMAIIIDLIDHTLSMMCVSAALYCVYTRRNHRYYIAKCLTRDDVFVLFIENKMSTYTLHVLGAAKRQLSILKFNFHIDILMAEASRNKHECCATCVR